MTEPWPKNIYVATMGMGVYFTSGFENPDIQPNWTPVNAGLPSLDVREFHIDPFEPDRYQYLVLENTRTIYYRKYGGAWKEGLNPINLAEGGSIGGFCCDTENAGILYAMCGAAGVVWDPDYWYLMVSYDHGAHWQRGPDAGGGSIWTYGIGSVRAHGGNIFYMTSQDLGALASVNNSHIDFNYVPWATIDPANLATPYTTINMLGSGYGDLARITEFDPGHGATTVFLQEDIGGAWRCDTMWFNRETPTHSRIANDGKIFSTRDSWATIYSQTSSPFTNGPISICPFNRYYDENQMFIGWDPEGILHHDHVIKAAYGEDATVAKGIAGAMALTSPFTGSIPYTCGGLAQDGIQCFHIETPNVFVHAVAMPKYEGERRGRPLPGDRSAWDVYKHPEKHAIDLGNLMLPYHHTPAPETGAVVYSPDGKSWVASPLSTASPSTTRETILTFSGELTVSDNPYKIYNLFGASHNISKVFLSVAAAPTGADLVVDVHKNGTTIFTNQAARPSITAGETTGYSVTIGSSLWSDGEYITAHIDQVGSTYPGSYLVVHVVHGVGASSGISFKHAYMMGNVNTAVHAFLQGPTGSVIHAYLAGPEPERASVNAYMKGNDNILTSVDAYIYGDIHTSSSTDAYMVGGY